MAKAGHEIESDVGLCNAHSGGSRYQRRGWVVQCPFGRVTISKARLGCAMPIRAGHEIKGEAGLCNTHSGGSRDQRRG